MEILSQKEVYKKKKFSFVSPQKFDKKRNDAILVHKIFTIMKQDRSEQFLNRCKFKARNCLFSNLIDINIRLSSQALAVIFLLFVKF